MEVGDSIAAAVGVLSSALHLLIGPLQRQLSLLSPTSAPSLPLPLNFETISSSLNIILPRKYLDLSPKLDLVALTFCFPFVLLDDLFDFLSDNYFSLFGF